jgi:hypothetical protein
MSAAISKLLTNFDANGRAKPPEKQKAAEPAARPQEIQRDLAPSPKVEAPPVNLLDDAYRRGFAAAMSEVDAKLAEERVRSAVRLGEERAKWSDQQAVAIVNGFAAACRELEANIAESVARILQPFLADAIRDKAVAALAQQITALSCNSPTSVFRVSAPRDLLDLITVELDRARRTGIEYEVADTVEVRVVADQTVIETQMSAWIERLNEVRR